MRCVAQYELAVVETVFCDYHLTDPEYNRALDLVEARAMDTTRQFKAYDVAHDVASGVVQER